MHAIALFTAITLIPCALLLAFTYFIDWWYVGRHTCAHTSSVCGDCIDAKQQAGVINLYGKPFTK